MIHNAAEKTVLIHPSHKLKCNFTDNLPANYGKSTKYNQNKM